MGGGGDYERTVGTEARVCVRVCVCVCVCVCVRACVWGFRGVPFWIEPSVSYHDRELAQVDRLGRPTCGPPSAAGDWSTHTTCADSQGKKKKKKNQVKGAAFRPRYWEHKLW